MGHDRVHVGAEVGGDGAMTTPRSGDQPVPLTDPVVLPPFPVDALPEPVAAMVSAVAEATQTDPAMAGTAALSVLAGCCGGHAEVEVRSGWREILALHTATVAEPGERKSVVQ
jgi:replicative DNA helicase